MRKLTTLTGKNLPKLSVAKPGWPGNRPDHEILGMTAEEWEREKAMARAAMTPEIEKQIADFTRVYDQTGLSERLRATWNTKKPRQPEG